MTKLYVEQPLALPGSANDWGKMLTDMANFSNTIYGFLSLFFLLKKGDFFHSFFLLLLEDKTQFFLCKKKSNLFEILETKIFFLF